jgi:hypothetical protein
MNKVQRAKAEIEAGTYETAERIDGAVAKLAEALNRSEAIEWVPVGDSMPDADTTVLLFAPDSCDPVWPGYHDGDDGWKWADGQEASGVTHWAAWPTGPDPL